MIKASLLIVLLIKLQVVLGQIKNSTIKNEHGVYEGVLKNGKREGRFPDYINT